MPIKVFIFKKFQGAQILIFFDENWHGASFYIKEQTQKYKFEIWLLKSTILDPQKSAFLVFEETRPKNFFFVFRLWLSFKNNRRTTFLLIFENSQKKSSWTSKTPFWPFLAVNNVFFAFLKILIKITFVRLLILKLKQKKIWRKIFMVFISKLKNALFLVVNQFFQFFFFSSSL